MKTFFKILVFLALFGGIGFGVYGYKNHGSMDAHWKSVQENVPFLKKVAGFVKKKASEMKKEEEDEQRDSETEEPYRNIEPDRDEDTGDQRDDEVDRDRDSSGEKNTNETTDKSPSTDKEEETEQSPSNTSLSASKLKTLREKLDKSRDLLDRAEYEESAKVLDSFPWGEMPPDMESSARDMRKKSSQLKNVVELMNLKYKDQPPVLVTVKLYNGATMEGLLVEEDEETLTIRMYESNVKQTLDKVNLKNIDKKSVEETKAEYRKQFLRKKQQLPEGGPVLELYNLAKFGLRHGLKKESAEVLDRAYRYSSGGNLTQNIIHHLAGILYENYKFFKGRGMMDTAMKKKKELLKKYPDSKFTRMIKGEDVARGSQSSGSDSNTGGSSSDQSDTSEHSGGNSSSGGSTAGSGGSVRGNDFVTPNNYSSSAVKQEVKKAISIFDEAMQHFDTASNESLSLDRRKQANNKARTKLVNARTHVRKAQKMVDGEDKALESFFNAIQDKFGTCYRRAKVWAGFHRK